MHCTDTLKEFCSNALPIKTLISLLSAFVKIIFMLLILDYSGSSGHLHRNNLAPVSMQWAIRNRDSSMRTAGLRVTGGSNLVFIDSTSLRRTTATSAVAAAQEPIIMGTSTTCLARAFGIVIRQIADLLVMMQDYKTLAPSLPRLMEITYQDALNLQV